MSAPAKQSLWARVRGAAAKVKAWVGSWRSARESTRFSETRSWRGETGRPRDPNDANDERSRQLSIELSQDMERNDPVAIRLGNIYTQYTVGCGLRVKAASSSPEWNALNQAKWDLWSKMPDLASTQDFDSFIVMAVRRDFYDGGGYILKTRGDSAPYYPRLQFIAAANIQTPPELSDRKNIFDGKETENRGRITAYYVRQVINGEESFRRIDASAIIPICDFDYPGELHTFPHLDPVLNRLRDLSDLRKLALGKAKEAAEITNVINTETGELKRPSVVDRRFGSVTGTTKGGAEVTEDTVENVRVATGNRTIALKVNEKISQLRAESPNEIEQAHYRIIASEICAGVNIPMMLVFPESVQGTVARSVLDDFAIYCRNKSRIYQRIVEECYRYVTSEHINIDRVLAKTVPPDWWRCSTRPPRAPNVDVGRDMNARIGALEVGGATLDDFYVPLGLDTEEQIDRGFQILKKIKEAAEHYEVPVEWFQKAIAQVTKDAIDAEQKAQQSQDSPQQQAA